MINGKRKSKGNKGYKADEAGTGGISDHVGPQLTRPPTSVVRDSTTVNQDDFASAETATTNACTSSGSNSGGGQGGANEDNRSAWARENNGGPDEKRRKLPGFTITTRVSSGSMAASIEYNRAEIGKLTAGLSWARNSRGEAEDVVTASGTCDGDSQEGDASPSAQGFRNDDNAGAGAAGTVVGGTGSERAVELLKNLSGAVL